MEEEEEVGEEEEEELLLQHQRPDKRLCVHVPSGGRTAAKLFFFAAHVLP